MLIQGKVKVSLEQFRHYLLKTPSAQLKAQGFYMSLIVAQANAALAGAKETK